MITYGTLSVGAWMWIWIWYNKTTFRAFYTVVNIQQRWKVWIRRHGWSNVGNERGRNSRYWKNISDLVVPVGVERYVNWYLSGCAETPRIIKIAFILSEKRGLRLIFFSFWVEVDRQALNWFSNYLGSWFLVFCFLNTNEVVDLLETMSIDTGLLNRGCCYACLDNISRKLCNWK